MEISKFKHFLISAWHCFHLVRISAALHPNTAFGPNTRQNTQVIKQENTEFE